MMMIYTDLKKPSWRALHIYSELECRAIFGLREFSLFGGGSGYAAALTRLSKGISYLRICSKLL